MLDAARERMRFIFDEFEDVRVSISGGKDSTVLLALALQEAERRGRKIHVFFLDQEAEYAASVELIRKQMSHPLVIPEWYQVPIYMTNSTSYTDYFLYAFDPSAEDVWVHPKEKIAIKDMEGEYPKRFYEFFRYIEDQNPKAAYLVGLRAEEGITRFRAVTKFAGYKGLRWSTLSDTGAARFYPIYDWTWNSVWKFIYDYNLPYNRMYDCMYWANYSMFKMRVSNLIHEKSYKCLRDLPRFEPETYDRLCTRLSGVATASRYASERLVFSNKHLPTHYKSWREFRDFLLENIPDAGQRERFRARFAKQKETERIFQGQVGQLLLNDYENSRSFDTKKEDRAEKIKERWREIL